MKAQIIQMVGNQMVPSAVDAVNLIAFMNKLRIHAGQFAAADKAQALIDENAADNPDFEWKVVELYREAA